VAVHAEIRLLVRLTSSFGDRFVLYYVSLMECDMVWSISIYDHGGLHNLNYGLVSSRRLRCVLYDISIPKPASAVSIPIYTISSILFYIGLSTLASSTPT
jgi:hypothetical protein